MRTHSGAPLPHAAYCFWWGCGGVGGGIQSYLLYYIIYMFRLFLGLIAIEAQI